MSENKNTNNYVDKKKPHFVRQSTSKKSRVWGGWRRPRGIDSKQRLKLKGYRRKIAVGYGSPKAIRGLIKGYKKIIVNSSKDLENLDKEKEGIIIASSVGSRKKCQIIKEAERLSIKILNIKDPKDYIKRIDDMVEQRKKGKEEKLKVKEKKTKEKEKAAEEKKKKEEKEKEIPEDELAEKIKQEEEKKKKEQDKILVTKQ